MSIATLTFDRGDDAPDWNRTDIYGLQGVVMAALDQHFSAYGLAAKAQREYRAVQAAIEGDSLTLFGSVEAMRAGLAAHPMAFEWSAFEQEATAQIAPYCFSIRFTG